MTVTASAGSSTLGDVARSDAALRAFLHGLPGVDQVGADDRAAMLATRSIKTTAKTWAIDLAIRMVDLTTLEGADTPGKIRALCAKAAQPDPTDPSCPPVAAVCVYPAMVPVAAGALAGSPILVASVATAFPSGQASLAVKCADTAAAIAAGADEIDMVINRGAFLSGRYLEVFEEIATIKATCEGAAARHSSQLRPSSQPRPSSQQSGAGRPERGGIHLKVILETGELATYDNVRRASWLAMLAGADFIKTSTGKVTPAATRPVTLVMLEAVRDFREATGRTVGVKPAGGIRTSKEAISYLVLVNETAGESWLTPRLFRIGASTLLNDLLMQRARMATGRYAGPDYVTLD